MILSFLWQFDDIGSHGTKIIIYKLWFNDDGEMELDFDADPQVLCFLSVVLPRAICSHLIPHKLTSLEFLIEGHPY